MIDITIKISTIFAMIAIGYGACKLRLINESLQKPLVSLLLNVNIPCMLLCSVTENELNEDMMEMTVLMIVSACVYFLIASGVSKILVRLFKVEHVKDAGVYKVIFTSTNAGFIGFPVAMKVFGSDILYFMILLNIVLSMYLYSLGTMQLKPKNIQRKFDIHSMKSALNLCTMSGIVGILFLFVGVKLPGYVIDVIGPIGDAAIPLAMIIIGIQLSTGSIRTSFLNAKLTVFSVIRLFVWPVIVSIIMHLLAMPEEIKIVFILAAAFPPAATISAIADNEGSNCELAANGIVLTTALSIVSIPISIILV